MLWSQATTLWLILMLLEFTFPEVGLGEENRTEQKDQEDKQT